MNSLPRITRDAAAQMEALRRAQSLAALIGAYWTIRMTVGFASRETREAFEAAILAAQPETERL